MAQPQPEDDLEKKLQDLGGLIGKMTEQNEALKNKIESNSAFNASVKTRVVGIKTNVEQLKTNLEKFKTKCVQLQTEIDGLQDKLGIKEEEIKSLQQAPASDDKDKQIMNLTKEVSTLKEKIINTTQILSNHYQQLSDLINNYKTIVDSIPSDTDNTELNESLKEIEGLIKDLLSNFPETDTSPGTNNDVGANSVGAINVGATSATIPDANNNGSTTQGFVKQQTSKTELLTLLNNILNKDRSLRRLSSTDRSKIAGYKTELGNDISTNRIGQIEVSLKDYAKQLNITSGGRKTHKRRRRKTHKKQKGGWKYNKGLKYSNRKTHIRSSKSRRTRSSK